MVEATNKFQLNIAAWNVHGIQKKLDIVEFVDRITSFDITFLVETWYVNNLELPNSYVYCKHASKITGKRRGRHSGGLAVVVKKNLKPGFKVIKNTAYGIWVKN